MRHDTRVRLIAALVMIASVASSAYLNPRIAASVGRHDLSFTETAEKGDPPQVALGVAMGAFRGLFVNILWIRANELKEQGKFHEAIELSRAITKLQPRFPQVWAFHAWNMAYNISVTTQTPEERYQWVMAGIRLLRDEGLAANPRNMLIHKELGWIYLHKIAGYTDDANQYYKRKVAEEWTIIMGEPPRPEPDQRSRDAMIDLYAETWLRPIIDAPESMSALRERNPKAAELASVYERQIGEPVGYEFLRRYTFHTILRRDRGGIGRVPFGPRGQAFAALLDDPQWDSAWDDLVAHVRKRVLVDERGMEPVRMLRLTRDTGPIDWRLPTAHSLYWGSRGVEVGRMVVDEHNSESVDFVNAYRILMQSIQELWRYGDLYYNFLDWVETGACVYQPMPNPYFVEAYGAVLEDAHDAVGIFGSERRAVRAFSAGYENFVAQAVLFFYRRGEMERAEHWYSIGRNFESQNAGMDWRIERWALTLDEFAQKEIFEEDRLDSPYVVTNQVTAALQSAFMQGLLGNNQELFDGQTSFARKLHAHYVQKQIRDVIASGGDARMQYLDPDFGFVAGSIFATVVSMVGPEEAELMYYRAPEALRKYAYDPIRDRYAPLFVARAEGEEPVDLEGRTFEEVFPEPEGMDQFRAAIERKFAERQARENQGLRQK